MSEFFLVLVEKDNISKNQPSESDKSKKAPVGPIKDHSDGEKDTKVEPSSALHIGKISEIQEIEKPLNKYPKLKESKISVLRWSSKRINGFLNIRL